MKYSFYKKLKFKLKDLLVNNLNFQKYEYFNSKLTQKQLYFYYKSLVESKKPLPHFREAGFKIYSQNDEDGILLLIFAAIGFTNKQCLDIAFAYPFGANTTNLICNWDFNGLLVSGNGVEYSSHFFSKHPDTKLFPPIIINKWVTAENINEICKQAGLAGEIDLFSLDVDGVDYWLWKSLDTVSPRVVVCEYANFWPADEKVTVPYSENFNRNDTHPDFMGASLAAFVELAKQKNYRLIGCNKYCFNAFFLRNDLAGDIFPEVSVESCLSHKFALDAQNTRLAEVRKLPWLRL